MRSIAIGLGILLCGVTFAQSPQPMPLWNGAAPDARGSAEEDVPTLTVYLPAQNPTHTGIVIAPGGGYTHLATEKEGTVFAQWLNAHGVAAFVLKYRLGPKYHHPVELGDAQRAIRTVRSKAKEYGIAKDHIGMMGFSAGGHLASTAGTHFDKGNDAAPDPIDHESSRPDFLVLGYPVIEFGQTFTHKGSEHFLLGDNPDPALIRLLSNAEQVTPQTPPTFLFHTSDDPVVPVSNSVVFYEALIRNKVPVEMHLFRHGPHGVGMAQDRDDLKIWPELLFHWLIVNGWAKESVAAEPLL
jgi:acetyl esterase/lipase